MSPFLPPPPPSAPPGASAPARPAWRAAAVVAAVGLVGLAATITVMLLVHRPQTVRIEGQSMSPTLQHDDRAVFSRPRGPLRRGDIVSYRYPRDPRKLFVGRIVGLPGERIGFRAGIVQVDGAPLVERYLEGVPRPPHDLGGTSLGSDEYVVLGDNRGNASDSREWGPVPGRFILKRLVYVWWRKGGVTPPAPGTPSR